MGVLLLFCISCELEFTLWISPHSGSPLETREEKKEAICLSSPKLRRGMRRRGREIPEKQQHSLWKSLEIIVAIDGCIILHSYFAKGLKDKEANFWVMKRHNNYLL